MSKVRRSITIGISRLNVIDNPGPGISIIRAIKQSNFFSARFVGLWHDNLEPGIYMHNFVDKAYQIPLPSAESNVLYEHIAEIQAKEKMDVLIPNFDPQLYSFISIAERLETIGIKTFMPTLTQFEQRTKLNLYEFGKQHNILVPFNKLLYSLSELESVIKEFKFPVAIKGKSNDAGIAYSHEQVIHQFKRISSKWGLPVLIQEFIDGQEVNVTALGDGKGNAIGAVPMRKLYITEKGKAWAGITLDDPELLKITNKIIGVTKWRGSLEVEMIKTADGQYYLIEINPRFPAWVYLAVGAGQNHPEALVRMALGEKVRPFKKHAVGKLFLRYAFDLLVPGSEYEQVLRTGVL